MKYELGDIVKDSVTGFTGVVVAQAEWLWGCIRYAVQPQKVKKEGGTSDSEWFDEPRIILVKSVRKPKAKPYSGGPSRRDDPGY